MLAPPTGNMLDVYRRTAHLRSVRKIKREASKTINAVVQNSETLEAEITDEPIDDDQVRGDWYLVNAFPGDDLRALRWLARRRFGTWQVMKQRTDKQGNVIQGWEPAFPGWLFVFVLDIKKMKSRMLACPGVMSILCDPVSMEPIGINQPGKGDKNGRLFIDKLRELSWVYKENAPRARPAPSLPGRRKSTRSCAERRDRTRRDKQKVEIKRLKNTLKVQGKWDQSTWEVAHGLAPEQRIALLHRLVGYAAVAA